jgi:hypothetical protein
MQLISDRLESQHRGVSVGEEEMRIAISVGQEKTRNGQEEMIQTL